MWGFRGVEMNLIKTFFSNVKRVYGHFFSVFIQPKSVIEDEARREFILNIFLLVSIILLLVALTIAVRNAIILGADHHGSSPWYIGIIFLLFVGLLASSRFGFYKAASYTFVLIYLLSVVNGIYTFGVNEPQTLLGFAMLIVMSGVLIGSRFAFYIMLVAALSIITLGYAQVNHLYAVKAYWKNQAIIMDEPIMFSITLGIIAITAWLSNREIEKSLARARRSEADLKKERDSLEVTVEKRTRELKETQAEKMTQLYRFAEFGRLSSGLFHDLINPLTAVSLNMDKATSAAKKMENMVNAVRKQFVREDKKALFSLNTEIKDAVAMLAHRAQKSNVVVKFSDSGDVKFYGDAIKFNQIILNLVANAIDSYMLKTGGRREVLVSLSNAGGRAEISVRDYGAGISKENLPKIFDPFFTTKGHERGTGIGLSIVKRIVEKDFGGSIEVKSKENKGSEFVVKFPIKTHD